MNKASSNLPFPGITFHIHRLRRNGKKLQLITKSLRPEWHQQDGRQGSFRPSVPYGNIKNTTRAWLNNFTGALKPANDLKQPRERPIKKKPHSRQSDNLWLFYSPLLHSMDSLFNNWCWENWILTYKVKGGPWIHTVYKN